MPHDRTIDLDTSGPSLELGTLGDDEADLPAPVAARGPEFDMDLPAPVGPGGNSHDLGLDLPAPVRSGGHDDMGLDLPAPVGPRGGGLDDFGADLPAPVQGRSGGASDFDLDLPAPVSPAAGGGNEFDLDLPAPVGDLADLPTPVADLDLPTPVADLDLPTPAVDLDMLEPVDNLPVPAENLPAPAGDLAPVEDLDLDLDFVGESTDPGSAALIPDVPTDGTGSNLVDAHDRPKLAPKPTSKVPSPTAPMTSPAPKAGPAGLPVSKPVLYGAAGALVLALAGVGLWASGVIGGGGEQPPPDRGAVKPTVPTVPAGEVAERAPPIMKELELDTPAGYQRALALSEQAGDKVGQAEAALLMHLRYGPDPVLLGQATGLLEPYASHQEPFVARVRGLAALANGNLEGARAGFAGDDPRAKLYLAWIELQSGNAKAALEAAKAAAARENDKAAELTLLEATFAAEGEAVLDDMIAKASQYAEQPAYHVALTKALFEAGRYADAAKIADEMPPLTSTSDAYQGRVLALRSELALAQGQRASALRLLDSAREKAPNDLEITRQQIEAYIEAGDLRAARREAEIIVQNNPDLPLAVFAAIKTDLATGEGDSALGRIDKLAAAMPDDPRLPFLRGRVLSMRSKTDEARTAFAAAREKSPIFAEATVEEARMLGSLEKSAEAVTLLDEQIEAVKKIEASERDRGRALAQLYYAKAERLLAQDEREEAMVALDHAVTNAPADNKSRLRLALTLLSAGETEEGQETLIKLYERTGGFPGLAGPLGRVFLRRKQLDKLEQLIGGQLSEPEKADDEILLTGARLRIAQEKYEEALKLAKFVLTRNPASWEARLLKGQAHLLSGDVETGLIEIEQAKPREPDGEVEMWLGQALEYNGRADEALAHYKAAMDLDPQLLEAAALYGRQLAYLGRSQAALDALAPVIAETDDYPFAYVAKGIALRDAGKEDEAIKAFKKAAELDSEDFEAYYWEGRLHANQNRHSQTARAMSKAVEVGQKGSNYYNDALRRLGKAYEQLGQKDNAKKAYTQFLESAPANDSGRKDVQTRLSKL